MKRKSSSSFVPQSVKRSSEELLYQALWLTRVDYESIVKYRVKGATSAIHKGYLNVPCDNAYFCKRLALKFDIDFEANVLRTI